MESDRKLTPAMTVDQDNNWVFNRRLIEVEHPEEMAKDGEQWKDVVNMAYFKEAKV